MAVLPQYKLVARKARFLKLQYCHTSGNKKPYFWQYFIDTTLLFLAITYCQNMTILAILYCQKLEHAQWALLVSLPLIISLTKMKILWQHCSSIVAVLRQYKLVARKARVLKLQYCHNSGNNKPDLINCHNLISGNYLLPEFLQHFIAKNYSMLSGTSCVTSFDNFGGN